MDRTSKEVQWGGTSPADDFCCGHCSGVFITMTRDEFAQFAFGQLIALAMSTLVLAVIVLLTSPVRAGQQATSALPSVAGGKPQSITGGVENNLVRPDGKLTETVFLNSELTLRRFELIKQAAPGSTRVAVLWEPDAYGRGDELTLLQDVGKAALATGLSLLFVPIADPAQLETAFSEITRGEPDAVVVMPSPTLVAEHKLIAEWMAKTRLPAIYDDRVFVEDGGLMSYGPYQEDARHRHPAPTDNIQDKTNPPDLSLRSPTKFEFIINLKAAKVLGIEIPLALLSRADEVIE